MNQKGFALNYLIIGLVVVVLIGGAYYLGVKGNLSPKTSSTPKACTQEAKICPDGSAVGRTGPNCEFTPCPSATPIESIDETANWKTYTNTKYGFSVKYPEFWYSYTGYAWNDDPKNDFSHVDLSPEAPPSGPAGGRPSGARIVVDDNKDKISVYDYAKKLAIDPNSVHNDAINGIQVVRTSGEPSAGNGGPNVFIARGTAIITISSESLDEKTFNQILSTFRFD